MIQFEGCFLRFKKGAGVHVTHSTRAQAIDQRAGGARRVEQQRVSLGQLGQHLRHHVIRPHINLSFGKFADEGSVYLAGQHK